MAHWHDFNPWAAELIYIPDENDAVWLLQHSQMPSIELESWHKYGPKIDIYMLRNGLNSPLAREYHLGIRFGKEGSEYLSPYIDQERAKQVYSRYATLGISQGDKK